MERHDLHVCLQYVPIYVRDGSAEKPTSSHIQRHLITKKKPLRTSRHTWEVLFYPKWLPEWHTSGTMIFMHVRSPWLVNLSLGRLGRLAISHCLDQIRYRYTLLCGVTKATGVRMFFTYYMADKESKPMEHSACLWLSLALAISALN